MFKFKSPVISEHVWKICFMTDEEMSEIYYADKETEDKKEKINGILEFMSSTIYINENLDESLLLETLREKLMVMYLWETGQQDHNFSEEEFCDLISVASPLICKTAESIVLKLKKKGEF